MLTEQKRDTTTCRLALVRRAAERVEELLAIVLATMFEQLPEYGNARRRGDLEDIRSGVRRSIELCLRVLVEARRIDSDERVALHLTGGQRARQGIPKAAVLRSVTLATRDGYNFFVKCAEEADHFAHLTDALQQIRTILAEFEDDAIQALAEGHDEACSRLLTTEDRGEAILVDRLLERRWNEDEELAEHARANALQPNREARVLVVTALDVPDEKRLRATVGTLRDSLPMAVGALRSGSRMHLPAVIQPRDDDAWCSLSNRLHAAAAARGTTVIVGERVANVFAVSPSYKAIEHGLPFLRAATGRPGVVPALLVRFHRVTCIGKPADRMELLNDVLGPLLSLPRREAAELLESLDALYETGGSWASLARTLGRHKNTFSNRMRRVLDVTGLDIRKPAERHVLEAMLRLRFVAEGDLSPPAHVHWRTDRPA